MPRFSIVVPAYNAEETLAETLDAVLVQTFGDWECVVVDDGSVDSTRALAESYAERDPRIRVVAQANKGTGGAYNTGVRSAVGEWVTICSADDVLLPEHLAEMHAAIEAHPEVGIVSCNGYYWLPDGSRKLVYPAGIEDAERSWSLADVFDRCFFSVGACYRREIHHAIGGYLEDVFGEDYDFWLRAMAGGAKHLYVPQALSLHRISATQKSANVARAYESDIRSIEGVVASTDLTPEERLAADTAIAHRRRLLSETASPNSPVNAGRRFARRIRAWVRGR